MLGGGVCQERFGTTGGNLAKKMRTPPYRGFTRFHSPSRPRFGYCFLLVALGQAGRRRLETQSDDVDPCPNAMVKTDRIPFSWARGNRQPKPDRRYSGLHRYLNVERAVLGAGRCGKGGRWVCNKRRMTLRRGCAYQVASQGERTFVTRQSRRCQYSQLEAPPPASHPTDPF